MYPLEPRANETVIFTSFMMVGLLPPFSAFFLAVPDDFGIQLLHLSPNSIIILAIFSHLCEMFIGVLPSVVLFHHYFTLWCVGQSEVTESCGFHLWDGFVNEYIPQLLKTKWDNWQQSWSYLTVEPHDRLALPTEPMAKNAKM